MEKKASAEKAVREIRRKTRRRASGSARTFIGAPHRALLSRSDRVRHLLHIEVQQ